MSIRALLGRPSAFVPLGMSLAALVLLVGYITVVGTQPQPDEGTAAHLWQLLMAGQLPVIAYFALRWLAVAPRQAAVVLALQVAAAMLTVAPIFLLGF